MGICDTVDPLGGSYYIETMSTEMKNAIRKQMADVEAQGDIIKAIAEGKIQEAISKQAYQREKGIQEGKVKKVGVNCFIKEEEVRTVEFHPYHEENAKKQIEILNKLKKERDNKKVLECLDRIKKDAKENSNLMPSVIEAVKAYATVGEITSAMKEVYGEYEEKIYF